MAAIAAAAVALLLYLAGINDYLGLSIGIAVVLLVIAGLSAMAGTSLGHNAPKTARWLLWAWTPGVILVSGAVGALVIYLGVQWATGDDASAQAKAVGAALAALVTLIGTNLGDVLEAHLAPWLASMVLWSKYKDTFPCLPPDLGPGRVAYEQLTDLHSAGVAAWTGPAIQSLLEKIAAAYAAGEHMGGDHPPPC